MDDCLAAAVCSWRQRQRLTVLDRNFAALAQICSKMTSSTTRPVTHATSAPTVVFSTANVAIVIMVILSIVATVLLHIYWCVRISCFVV